MGKTVTMKATTTKAIKEQDAAPLTPYELCAEIADLIEQLQDHIATGKLSRDYSIFLSVLWGEFDVMCSVFGEPAAPASEEEPAS
jgi:hypothetical protein